MMKCPRCHASMVLDRGDIQEAYVPLWHCLLCSQEVLCDPDRQVEESLLVRAITMTGGRGPDRIYGARGKRHS